MDGHTHTQHDSKSELCSSLKIGFWAVLGPLGPIFFSGLFVKPAVKHNGNELEYAKSAKSNVVNLRKIQFLGQFGPIWSILGPKHFFLENPKTSLF